MNTKIKALRASSPAMMGYLALGLSFGFLFQKAGAAWYFAPLMSLLVYAGAAQFIAITLLLHHSGLLQILSATLFVNLRHIFYGISFVGRFPKKISLKKFYMIFGLTDESYSILSARKNEKSTQFDFYVILFAHSYWIASSLLGAIIGKYLKVNLGFLAFSLTALFVVLALEHTIIIKRYKSLVIAAIAIVLSLLFFRGEMLISSLLIATVILLVVYLLEKKYGK